MKKPHVYEETYQNYLSQLGELDFKEIEHKLNVQMKGSLIRPAGDLTFRSVSYCVNIF